MKYRKLDLISTPSSQLFPASLIASTNTIWVTYFLAYGRGQNAILMLWKWRVSGRNRILGHMLSVRCLSRSCCWGRVGIWWWGWRGSVWCRENCRDMLWFRGERISWQGWLSRRGRRLRWLTSPPPTTNSSPSKPSPNQNLPPPVPPNTSACSSSPQPPPKNSNQLQPKESLPLLTWGASTGTH